MKLILSRKGFDSSAGRVPSPILPDGRLISLPIPDKSSVIKYHDMTFNGYNLGDTAFHLTKGRVRRDYRAHLDPDLRADSLPHRHPKWKPVFGQMGAAQSHLEKQIISVGDIFLFFGLFRQTEQHPDGLLYIRNAPSIHVL
jgi:hypothetical protein